MNVIELQEDLHTLEEVLDAEAPLQEIRIAALRALTRHRFFTEELLRLTGDWEPRLAREERDKTYTAVATEQRSELDRLASEKDGLRKLGEFMRSKVPPLPQEISERAEQPLGQLLKHLVHRIAHTSLRDREVEAGREYTRAARSFETEAAQSDNIQNHIETLPPARRNRFFERMMRCMKLAKNLWKNAEPGNNWVRIDEIIQTDEAFEENRYRILREEGQQLQLAAMVLDHRLKIGHTYSGLELLNDQQILSWPSETPDWEPDEERETLIGRLEELTGMSFRTEA